jgi:hypothetical protein
MRVLISGLIGGLVFFVWAAVAHMVLPIGEMGMKVANSEDPGYGHARQFSGEGVT